MVIWDSAGQLWLALHDDEGRWWAVAPRSEDDGLGSSDDRRRPIGPVDIDPLPLPLPWLVWQPGYDFGPSLHQAETTTKRADAVI